MVDKANLSREAYQTPLLRKMQQLSFNVSAPMMGTPKTESLQWFQKRNFRFVIVHDQYIPPEGREELHMYLESQLGQGKHYEHDQVWLYRLPIQDAL